jgi:adenylate cyclase
MHMPIPIRGPLSIPFKLLGIKISRMNPNLCNICETMFTKVKRKKQLIIPATVFFADLRGYTNLSQGADSEEVVGMLHEFYDECAAAVWERDGIVNKFIGDAVLAIFNFPILREDHVRQAVLAAAKMFGEKETNGGSTGTARNAPSVLVWGFTPDLLPLEKLARRTRILRL